MFDGSSISSSIPTTMKYSNNTVLLWALISICLWTLKSKCQASSSEDGDQDSNDATIFKLKVDYLTCRWVVELAYSDDITEDNQRFVDVGLRECESHYNQQIDNILDHYGFIGDAIRIWLEVINQYLLETPYGFEQLIRDDSIRNNNEALYQRLYNTLRLSDHNENRDTGSSRLLAENRYLKDALLYGLGICMHVRQTLILNVNLDFEAYWNYLFQLDRYHGEGNHKLTYLRELERQPENRDNEHRFSPIILLRLLNKLCNNLQDFPISNIGSEIERIAGSREFIDHTRQPILNLEYYPDGITWLDIIDILEMHFYRDCNHSDFFRFERGLNFLSYLIPLNSEVGKMIRVSSDRFVNHCYSRIAIKLQEQKIKLIPDDLATYAFSLDVRDSINGQKVSSLMQRMVSNLFTRHYYETTLGDRLFFTKFSGDSGRLMSIKDSISAYLDGVSGYCRFYADQYSDLYQYPDSALVQLVDLFDFLTSIYGHWTPISTEATGFYFMWRMCTENRLFPMRPDIAARFSLGLD